MDITFIKNELLPPEQLIQDPDNPNEMNNAEFVALKANIAQYGILEPVVIDQDSNIVDGQHRSMAAKELGIQVPCVRFNIPNPTDRRIIRQTLNKLRGKHNPLKDAEEFIAILKANEEKKLFDLTSIRENEFYRTIAQKQSEQEKDAVPEPPETPITQPGDLWVIGEHKIMCGDSCSPEDVAKLMGGEKKPISSSPTHHTEWTT
jgi:hypothetical protein